MFTAFETNREEKLAVRTELQQFDQSSRGFLVSSLAAPELSLTSPHKSKRCV